MFSDLTMLEGVVTLGLDETGCGTMDVVSVLPVAGVEWTMGPSTGMTSMDVGLTSMEKSALPRLSQKSVYLFCVYMEEKGNEGGRTGHAEDQPRSRAGEPAQRRPGISWRAMQFKKVKVRVCK